MTTIDFTPLVDAVAAGVRKALEGVSLGAGTVVAAASNKPREPYGDGNPGFGAPGAPVVLEVFNDKNVITAYWGFIGNVLWKIDDGTVSEVNGWHRVRISERQMFLMYVRYCQIMRFDGNMKAYQYDKPLGT